MAAAERSDSAPADRIATTSILWNAEGFQQRRSTVVQVPSYSEVQTLHQTVAEQVARVLELDSFLAQQQSWDAGIQGIILVIGSTNNLNSFIAQEVDQLAPDASSRVELTFTRGVTRAALDTHSVILTSGFDAGGVGYLGCSNRGFHHRIPLVGVGGSGLTTWPGDTKSSAQGELKRLQPDHTHYVLLDGRLDDLAIRKFRFDLVNALKPQQNSMLPQVAFVLNGTQEELKEVLLCVHGGIPVVIISGTGGIADQIARRLKTPDINETGTEIDALVLEVVQKGAKALEVIELRDIEGAVIRDLVKVLFSGA
eukprot:gene20701-24809_t